MLPDFLNRHEEDEDIRLFREDYPDVYDFVLKVLDGTCDKPALQAFNDKYGKELLSGILKIILGKASDKDRQAFGENYPYIYIPLMKMLGKQSLKPQAVSEKKSIREKFKKGDFIGQKYEVFDILGEGTFGSVYLVYLHETDNTYAYALKTFRDEYLEDEPTRDRFKKRHRLGLILSGIHILSGRISWKKSWAGFILQWNILPLMMRG